MSGGNWTKGQWVAGWCNGLTGDVVSWSCFLDEEECKQLPIACNGEAIAVIYYERDEDKVKANAQLIAAAPDLYEALNDLMGWWVNGDGDMPLRIEQRAKHVLAKARGESHA